MTIFSRTFEMKGKLEMRQRLCLGGAEPCSFGIRVTVAVLNNDVMIPVESE